MARRLSRRCKVALLVLAALCCAVIRLDRERLEAEVRSLVEQHLPPSALPSPTWSSVERVIRTRARRSSTVITHSGGESNSSSAGCILPKVAMKYYI